MKSVGEIMSIGRSFEEIIQKGLRMIGQGMHGFVGNDEDVYKRQGLAPVIRDHISLQITPAQESKIHKRHPSKQEQKHKQITAESQFSRQRFSVCHQAAYNFRRNGSFHRAINTGMYFIEKTWHVS